MQLKHVLAVKIAVTLLLWGLPLLFAPPFLLSYLGFPEPTIFTRLLGVAYIALVVAYRHGYAEAKASGPAHAIVRMGIVSNAGASILLLLYGITEAWSGWGMPARVYMWASLGATTLITIALMWKGRAG